MNADEALLAEVQRLRTARERGLLLADRLDAAGVHPIDPKVNDIASRGYLAGLGAAEAEAARKIRLALSITPCCDFHGESCGPPYEPCCDDCPTIEVAS